MALLYVAAGLIPALCGATAEFHVAPNGRDTSPGTKARPFATLVRARQAVRQEVARGLKEDVTVLVREGRHELAEPLVFGPEDGGTDAHSVTWRAATGPVVVSGGRRITGWRLGEGGAFAATIPEVRAGDWHFRELFVDGTRAVRARTPNADAAPNHFRLTGSQQAEDLSTHTLTLAPECLGTWSNVTDAEIVVFGEWEITRKRLEAVDPAAGTVTLPPPHVAQHPAIGPRPGMACYFENAPEMLDQPGEWYLDRTIGTLTYQPRPGEDMQKAEVIAPMLTRLMEVKGAAEVPVRNLHFRGLQFEHCAWPLPEQGHPGVQGTFHTPPPSWAQGWTPVDAALVWEWAKGCSFTDCALRHLGGAGTRLRQGCRGNVIEGNTIVDVGGNGVMVGEHYPGWDWQKGVPPAEEVATGNRIANNHITRCGQEYFGAVGVWVGFAEGTVVAHNLIHELPYTGVSVGWQWDPTPTVCKGNTIEYNHIYDVMGKLADGGCIYTLGYQPGTVLRGNVLHGAHYSDVAQQSSYSNNGIFLDQGSKDFLVEGNIIYDTAGGPTRFNLCGPDWHTWGENHFGLTAPAEGKRGNALQCNGAGVDIPHAPELDPQQLTVEAWVFLEAFPRSGDNRRWIVNKNDDEWTESHWGLVIAGPKVGAYLNIGGGRESSHELFSDDVLTLNGWNHLAMTYDGRDLRVYHNGALVCSQEIGKERVPGTTPLSIGKRQDGYVALTGRVDEVVLFSRVLTAEEVGARFRAAGEPPANDPSAVGQWSFEENAGDREIIEKAMEQAGPEPEYRERLGLREGATQQ
jgi:hypothetical protein